MDAVEEIKSRLSIEDVLSEYVQLKRAGRNFKGLSPFTSEKTPSFTVSPEKQIWHDFSSGRGGDMFTFIQEVEGVDFKGALDILARRAGVDLEQFQKASRGDTKQKERLYELLELATKFYQVQFSKSQLALEYVLKQRKFSKETALTWQLGYAPNTGDALVKFVKSKGFHEREITGAGLTNRFGGDMFRGRLIIPLQDAQGRVIGFTARMLLDEPGAPKYINTSQTPLYDKSRHVYGLHLAKETIRKSKFVVLAEGNLDVIASHQAGVKQCVATAGTALTEPHLKALNRFTGDIRLAFDADRAGLAATERAIPIASRVGVNLSVVTIPAGKDPDELIKQDKKLWEEVIQKPQYAVDWLIERYQNELDLTTSVGKRAFRDTVLRVVKTLKDADEQEHYVQKVAQIIDVSRDALRDIELGEGVQIIQQTRRLKRAPEAVKKEDVKTMLAQQHLMALLLLQPRLRDLLETLKPEYVPNEEARQIFIFLQEHPDFDGNPAQAKELIQREVQILHSDAMQGAGEKRTEPYVSYGEGASQNATQQRAETSGSVAGSAGEQAAGVQYLGDYVKMLVLQYEELYQDVDLLELRYEAERLQSYLVEQYVKTQKNQLSYAMQTATDTETQELLQQAKGLDALLNQFKGG